MDNIRINTIHTIFKNVSLKMIFNTIVNFYSKDKISSNIIDESIYKKIWVNNHGHYTLDEILNIYEEMYKNLDPENFNSEKTIFYLLKEFNSTVLDERNGKPVVAFNNLLKWQYASQIMGQEIFTCAFFANNDLTSFKERTNFSWSPIIKTDNLRLNNILKEGIAENHYHLKGSSQIFIFTWINLMNNIKFRNTEFEKFSADHSPLNKNVLVNDHDELIGFYHMCKLAYIVRVYLYTFVVCDNKNSEKKLEFYNLIFEALNYDENFLNINIDKFCSVVDEHKETAYHKQYENRKYVIDYSITNKLVQTDHNNRYLNSNIFAGERNISYCVFRKIYSGELSKEDTDLFYIYNVIKTKFRGELIQNNGNIGFKNFANYQDRKTIFIENSKIYEKLFYEAMVFLPLETQNILSFETRIAPSEELNGTIESIKKCDRLIYGNQQYSKGFNYKNFYTIHFIKRTELKKEHDFAERNYELRKIIKRNTLSIIKARENFGVNKRIKGIDACNFEIGTRPEVFAQAFRTLRKHRVANDYNLPELGITYHVGEDFLDILDGIRAISEAVNFLGMKSGDRLGHALALGLNVEKYYKIKNYCIILPKHDLLDNFAWLYSMINKYKIRCENFIFKLIENEFDKLFNEVYLDENGKNNRNEKMDITLHEYFKSMQLRGDSPYENSMKNIDSLWNQNAFNTVLDSKENEFLTNCRKDSKALLLYNKYHFYKDAKERGKEKIIYELPKELITYIQKVQHLLAIEISKKNIAIETNPTSNYLISTFDRYDEHPISTFNNAGLSNNQEEITNCPQISVSINTDDQGVFDTFLENEYALIVLSLLKQKRQDGSDMYKTEMVYDWIDKVRKMGLNQSFNNFVNM